MRVLHVLGKLDRGGVETWLMQVLRLIDRERYQMDFVVHTNDPGAYDKEVRELGGRIFPCLSPSNPWTYARNFSRILKCEGPYDVVHSHVHHFSGYVLLLAAMNGVPRRIAHSHTGFIQKSPSLVRRSYLAAMSMAIQRFATQTLAVSSVAKDSLFRGVRSCTILDYGVDPKRFGIETNPGKVRHELGIADGAVIIGHVGRFADPKNHEFLVEVAARVIAADPRVILLLVGDGPLRPKIEQQISRLGLQDKVVMAGLRSDVPQLLASAMDLFLFPSRYEGCPLALMEAQMAGLPCVVSDVIAPEADIFPELVTRMSLETSAEKWAEAVGSVLEKRTENVVKRAPRPLPEERSISFAVAGLAKLYSASCAARK
jgi:glycosyltransferase involved in cell wall biosynthesis